MRMPTTVKTWLIVLAVLAAAIFAIRLTGIADLEDNSQARNVGYAIDLVERGNWLVQYDLQGRILSKPPLHTWLVGILAEPFGLNRFTLSVPSFLAVAGTTWLVFGIGRRRFGLLAGGLAGLSMVMSQMMWRQMTMVRSDALFSLAIAGGAWAAFRAWETGRGWLLFWVCGAIAMLTKGPLGLLLASAGLLAWFWEQRTHPPAPRPGGSHRWGIVAFFAICLAWIVPALWFHGKPLIDKMIFDELLGHVTSADNSRVASNFAMRVLTPTINFLTRFVPFSLFACFGIFRAFRWPAQDESERRFERFLTCWILVGMLIFTIAAHHRADLLLPLWPAGALLSGRELARLTERMGSGKSAWASAAACMILIAAACFNYHPVTPGMLKPFRRSLDVRNAADAFRKTGIDPARLQFINSPATFQYYLGNSSRWKTPEQILASRSPGPDRMWVVTAGASIDPKDFAGVESTEVFRWVPENGGEPVVRVFELKWPS